MASDMTDEARQRAEAVIAKARQAINPNKPETVVGFKLHALRDAIMDADRDAYRRGLEAAATVAQQCAIQRNFQSFSAFDQQCRELIEAKQSEAERIHGAIDRLAQEARRT